VDQSLTPNAQMIKTQLETLVRLQGLDNEINQRRQQIQSLQSEVGRIEQSAGSLSQSLDEHKHKMEQLVKDRRDAERTIKERQEQVSKLSGQMFDVKTNDAYNALQSEVRQKKQENSLLEERVLEMMMAEDEMKAEQEKLAAALKQEHAKVGELQTTHRQELARLESDIAGVHAQWEIDSKDVSAELLDRYQRLRDAKGGVAIAKIENGICTGCRLTIRAQAAIELKKYRSLLTCDNCARILYAD